MKNSIKRNTYINNMRYKINIETPVYTPDGGGGSIVNWQEHATLWAAKFPHSANRLYELPVSEQITTLYVYYFVIRYNPSITTTMRLIHEGHIFNIRQVIPISTPKSYHSLLVEEGGVA